MEVFAVYAVRPKGRHLSQNDRNKIEFMFDHGVSQKEIAAFVGVHPSTICRELRRAQIILLTLTLQPALHIAPLSPSKRQTLPKPLRADL